MTAGFALAWISCPYTYMATLVMVLDSGTLVPLGLILNCLPFFRALFSSREKAYGAGCAVLIFLRSALFGFPGWGDVNVILTHNYISCIFNAWVQDMVSERFKREFCSPSLSSILTSILCVGSHFDRSYSNQLGSFVPKCHCPSSEAIQFLVFFSIVLPSFDPDTADGGLKSTVG